MNLILKRISCTMPLALCLGILTLLCPGCQNSELNWREVLETSLSSQKPDNPTGIPSPQLLELTLQTTIKDRDEREAQKILQAAIELSQNFSSIYTSSPDKTLGESEVPQLLYTPPKSITTPLKGSGTQVAQWLADDESYVQQGDPIALLNVEGYPTEFKATTSGRLIHHLEVGQDLGEKGFASIFVSGEELVVPLTLAAAKANPKNIAALALTSSNLRPKSAASIVSTLCTSFPNCAPEILKATRSLNSTGSSN